MDIPIIYIFLLLFKFAKNLEIHYFYLNLLKTVETHILI